MPIVNIDMNPAYMDFMESNAKYQILYGGAGSGKSRAIAIKITMMLLQEKRRFIVVRAYGNTHRDSTFSEFKTVFQTMGIIHLMKIRETDMHIEFPNGSELIFKSGDDEQKLLSLSGVSGAWLEECNELNYDTIVLQIFMRIRTKELSNHFFFSFNPVSRDSWVRTKLVENEEIKPEAYILKTTYKDNLFLSESYINTIESMQKMNYRKWLVFACGDWGTTGELIFEDNWKEEIFNVDDLITSDIQYHTCVGLDFGFNHPSALVCSLVDIVNKRIYIFDEFYKTGCLNSDLADAIIEKGMAKQVIHADSAEPKSIQSLRNKGIRKIKGVKKGQINAGIDFLQQFEIIIHAENCLQTINEFKNYCWKKNRDGTITNQPEDAYNHAIDALRYSLEDFMTGINRVRTMSKSALGL